MAILAFWDRRGGARELAERGLARAGRADQGYGYRLAGRAGGIDQVGHILQSFMILARILEADAVEGDDK